MNIFNSIQSFKSGKRTVVTIGTFDGVHQGHKKILNQLCQSAEQLNCESLVLTFSSHPRLVLQEGSEMKLLNTVEEKINLLENSGIDNLVIHHFDKEFSRMTAEEFVKDVLVACFKVKKIIIGYDHRFGRNRTATIEDLIEFGKKYGFEVEQISVKEINDVSISSTKIRNALSEGNVELANKYLGYEYCISGIIVRGKQLGRTIGFPTANIKIEDSYKLIPLKGAYVAKCELNGTPVQGMLNIGTNPTVSGTKQSIEVHFLNFNEDIYDKKITVSLLKRIRSEQKFDSIESLKAQLNLDKIATLEYFKS